MIKFNSLSGDSGQWGPYSPYKPCNRSLYIGIIIFQTHWEDDIETQVFKFYDMEILSALQALYDGNPPVTQVGQMFWQAIEQGYKFFMIWDTMQRPM